MIAAIAHLHQGNFDCRSIISLPGATTSPFIPSHSSTFSLLRVGRTSDKWGRKESNSGKIWSNNQKLWREKIVVPKSSGSSNSNGTVNESSSQDKAFNHELKLLVEMVFDMVSQPLYVGVFKFESQQPHIEFMHASRPRGIRVRGRVRV